jgi:hypothetical protein
VALQFCVCIAVHATHWFAVLHTWLPVQSGSLRHCTHTCGCTMVSHTGFGDEQSALLLHGSLMHIPTDPLVAVQYFPVAQLVVPASSVVRHPAVHTPLEMTPPSVPTMLMSQ